ncbi:hypothetical protein FNV43_RR21620 [Rhamnella rubrinervis]|uniref:Uncharacterized protein n=1 Tax=Rhamnella rubrinervis TaxID=2594499 RepID=A0A8K0DVH3_9ROSA|nr:hypothetical protein FNV43_RR21620 [Rhamnella rubrinervis]
MALPSNRSSSSPISGRVNPNARNSKIGNPIRRSFAGNPFTKPSIVPNLRGFNPNTPVNSPSEHPRRNSMGRDPIVTLRDYEDKENGKDQNWKPIKVRSPIDSKDIKNFMSLTISTASKISPSPRKKILVERNEPLSTSVSFSVSKIPYFSQVVGHSDLKEKGPTSPVNSKASKIEAIHDSEQLLGSNTEPDSLPKTVTEEPHSFNVIEEPDSVNLDPSFKISPPASSSFPIIAPLDSDLMPPYDPKTNYICLRPQFLHYRPNTRVKFYLEKENEGKRIEDSLISETFSDIDATEETPPEYSQKEFEDVSSEEMSKGQSKPRFFWRKKLIFSLMVLSFACLSISAIHSPVIDPSMFEGATFSKLYDHSEIAGLLRASFNGFDQNLWVWSAKAVSFISELITNLRGEPNLGTLHYCNLTAWLEDVQNSNEYMVFDHCGKRTEGNSEMNKFGARRGIEVYIENLEEKGLLDIGYSVEFVDASSEIHAFPKYEEQVHQEAEPSVENINPDSEEVSQPSELEVIENQEQVPQEAEPDSEQVQQAPEAEADEVQPEVLEVGKLQGQSEMSSGGEVELPKEDFFCSENPEVDDVLHKNAPTIEVVELKVNGSPENTFSIASVLGIASLFVSLIVGTTFIYVNRRKNSTLNASNSACQPLATKKLDSISTIPIHTFQEKPASWNWVEVSYPSEMSSFNNSGSSYRKKPLKGLNEAESQERKSRKNSHHMRESLASSSLDSSMGSPSYGSFTTYEKIPSKHVDTLYWKLSLLTLLDRFRPRSVKGIKLKISTLTNVESPIQAELKAIEWAFETATEKHWSKVIKSTDAQAAIKEVLSVEIHVLGIQDSIAKLSFSSNVNLSSNQLDVSFSGLSKDFVDIILLDQATVAGDPVCYKVDYVHGGNGAY